MSAICGNCFDYERLNHSNYTPAPPATEVVDAPAAPLVPINADSKAAGWDAVWDCCMALGMALSSHGTGEQDVCAFIRDLHRRANETRYTAEEIRLWLETLPLNGYAVMKLKSPLDGIAAVTERGE